MLASSQTLCYKYLLHYGQRLRVPSVPWDFHFSQSCETRSANHCSYWPCMEISCLNRTLCSNGIRSEPLVCLLGATEGHRDKRWWEPDSSTVNQEVFPGTLLMVRRSLKPRWEQQMELVPVWRHCYSLQFFANFFFFAKSRMEAK